jgi:hypothetical protein
MANPSTATAEVASHFIDQVRQLNRDSLERAAATAEAGLTITFEAQNAALASGLAWFDASVNFTRDAYSHYADVTKQVQANALKTYQGLTTGQSW